jgi:4-amino-4-deoxy-L-arabinose transferase-like glycosyltransferase
MAKKTTPSATGPLYWFSGPLPVVALVICHVALGLSAAARKSMTFDESAHLGGGLGYWAANDYRLHSENGNWSQRWGTLPLYLKGYRPDLANRSWAISDVWGITENLLNAMGSQADSMLARCRAMTAMSSALLALLVYFWSRYIFGAVGGVISLALYAFSPGFLANGFLVTSDVMATLFFTASCAALWALLHRVSWLTLVVSVISLTGLVLSKYSGVLIAPMAMVMVIVRLASAMPLPIQLFKPREIHGRLRQSLTFAVVAIVQTLGVVLLVWASYGFRYDMFAPEYKEGSTYQVPWTRVEGGMSGDMATVVQYARDHHLLPEGYLYGFSYTLLYAAQRAAFLNGMFSYRGWTSFFPLCLLWKTPLELFVLLWLAVWALVACPGGADSREARASSARRARLYQLTPLAVLFTIYWIVALKSTLNIGHRHILPTYPPMFIFAGAVGLWFSSVGSRATIRQGNDARGQAARGTAVAPQKLTVPRSATIVLAALSGLEAIGFWPHYLAYFNFVAGGPTQGYRRLVDSSLDWGQDLGELKTWLDAHPIDSRDPQRVYLSYFGTALPAAYGIRAQELPKFFPVWNRTLPTPLTGGLYCISASMLQSVYTVPYFGRWNEEFEAYYQRLRQVVVPFQRAAHDPAALQLMYDSAPRAELEDAFTNYRTLRFSRLCSFLRQREPDDQVGYSILIYRLTDEDIAAALDGAPCELLPGPEGTEPEKGPDDAKK